MGADLTIEVQWLVAGEQTSGLLETFFLDVL